MFPPRPGLDKIWPLRPGGVAAVDDYLEVNGSAGPGRVPVAIGALGNVLPGTTRGAVQGETNHFFLIGPGVADDQAWMSMGESGVNLGAAGSQLNVTNLGIILDAAFVTLPEDTTIGGTSAAEITYLRGVTAPIQGQMSALPIRMAALNRIVFIGDSLTKGEADGAITAEPTPELVGAMLGVSVENRGLQGWIPRQRAWKYAIDDLPTVLRSDLLAIPPTQWQDRINQPASNYLATLVTDGAQKWVHDAVPGERTSTLYTLDLSSTATPNGDTVLMPTWVGPAANNPEYLSGRWLKTAGTYVAPENSIADAAHIVELGANGMEAADCVYALQFIRRNTTGPLWWVPLLPRLAAAHADTPNWLQWCGECNVAMEPAFPGRCIPIHDYILGRRRSTLGRYVPADAADTAAIAAGVVPPFLHDGGGFGSHYNMLGYRVRAAFIAQWVGHEMGLVPGVRTPLGPAGTLFYSFTGASSLAYSGELLEVANLFGYSAATSLSKSGVGPLMVGVGRERRARFDATRSMSLAFSAPDASPYSFSAVLRFRSIPTARVDVLGDTAGGSRPIVRVTDAGGGAYRWNMYADGGVAAAGVDTGVAADTAWHSVAAVFDGAASYFYMDGVSYGPFNPGAAPCAGLLVNNLTFPGAFDVSEISFTPTALSASVIGFWHAANLIRFPLLFAS